MKKFAQFDASGRVFAVVETTGELIGADVVEVAAGVDPMGKRYNAATQAFDAIQKTEAETALEELRAIDAETGMTRLMRETLIAIAGAAVPAKLAEAEARAAVGRGKLAK
ncbi:MAG: hypothetical protein U0932_01075 [Thiobacillus sp.]|nr:hypothetical protein [Thiobacillus sp.]